MSLQSSREVVSGALSPPQVLREVAEISYLLTSEGLEDLTVECGWGCQLATDQLWKLTEVKANDLPNFIQTLVNGKIYTPGQADLIVRDTNRTLLVRLCHESDVHISTANEVLLKKTVTRWIDEGYGGVERVGKAWVPLEELWNS